MSMPIPVPMPMPMPTTGAPDVAGRVVSRSVLVLLAVLAVLLATGCGSNRDRASAKAAYRQPLYPNYPRYGQVAAIDLVRLGRSPTQRSATINVLPGGAAPYAPADYVIGDTADAARADSLDPRVRVPRGPDGPVIYRVTVKLDDGYVRSFDYEQLGGLRLGDRVRVEQDQLSRY